MPYYREEGGGSPALSPVDVEHAWALAGPVAVAVYPGYTVKKTDGYVYTGVELHLLSGAGNGFIRLLKNNSPIMSALAISPTATNQVLGNVPFNNSDNVELEVTSSTGLTDVSATLIVRQAPP